MSVYYLYVGKYLFIENFWNIICRETTCRAYRKKNNLVNSKKSLGLVDNNQEDNNVWLWLNIT